MKKQFLPYFVVFQLVCAVASAQENGAPGDYRAELNIPYCTVDGKTETLNAFLPDKASKPAPAMVEIHGGWWTGGGPANNVETVADSRLFRDKRIALFSIHYRLGAEGGFPQNIRDCRNAIRFIRQNAARFNIDPTHIGVMGGSAGGHLSLMVAMVPEDFDDGGPTPELRGVSAKVCAAFSWIPPMDFVRFWDQGPEDVLTDANGKTTFRSVDPHVPADARPHLRVLFHGLAPDTEEHKAFYTKMCPVGNVRAGLPPLLICDGENDPIVPGLEGKELQEKLHAAGADSTYWMTAHGGHAFPSGPGFTKVLDDFVVRTLLDHAAP